MRLVALALLIAGLAYAFKKPDDGWASQAVMSNQPIRDIDRCLVVYGQKISQDFRRVSAGFDVAGPNGSKSQSNVPGAIYRSADLDLRVPLKPSGETVAMEISSVRQLEPAALGILRWCAAKGTEIPFDWNDVAGTSRDG